jgi:hypothetical protein
VFWVLVVSMLEYARSFVVASTLRLALARSTSSENP